MAERYTSYATSRALREAGAPQGELQSPEGETFWRSYTSKYHEDPGKKLRCQKSEGPMSETDPRAEARKLIEWYKLWNLGQPSREVDWASAVMAKAVRDFAAALRASLEREEQATRERDGADARYFDGLRSLKGERDAVARLTAERDETTKEVARLAALAEEIRASKDAAVRMIRRAEVARDLATRTLRNLVAVIDHDGGERQVGESPTETSARAIAAVAAERADADRLRAELARVDHYAAQEFRSVVDDIPVELLRKVAGKIVADCHDALHLVERDAKRLGEELAEARAELSRLTTPRPIAEAPGGEWIIVECYDMHVYCDVPGCRRSKAESPGQSRRDSMRLARKAGWKLGERDVCPACVRDGKKPGHHVWGETALPEEK